MAQFMQVSMSNHKSTESAIKNLEIQVGQLAKQIVENSSGSFGANTEKNPKEECKVVMTRKKVTMVEDEERTSDEQEEEPYRIIEKIKRKRLCLRTTCGRQNPVH